MIDAPRRRWLADLAAPAAALATYLGLAGYLTAGLWRSPDRRALSFLDGADELLLQWYLAHAAHAVTHLGNPFFTTDINMPAGVNLAANASVLGLGVPLAPLTLLFGAGVTTCLVVLGSLAGTATAWYWLLSRQLRLHRGAAWAGGLFCGFAPPLVLESAYGHQHIAAQFLVPLIAWRFVRLADGRPLRGGLIFGGLVAYQALIGEEVLLLTAVGVAGFALAYALLRPREARAAAPAVARGLLVGAAVAASLLAVPLAYQFAGPQHYGGNPIDPQPFHADLLDYLGLPDPTRTPLASALHHRYPVAGLPVVLLLLAFARPLRRNVIFTSALLVFGGIMLLSLGTRITVDHHRTGLPGPWRAVAHLPVFEWVIPERIGQLAVPAAGVAIAVIVDRALTRWHRLGSPATLVATALALATLTPLPFTTLTLPRVPRFVTAGTWRGYVPPGRSLTTVPAPSLASFDAMRWASATRGDVPITGGYFLGPSADGRSTLFGPPTSWTTGMLETVARSGRVWAAAPGDRDRLLRDLRYGRVSVLVLVPGCRNAHALRATVEAFLGPAHQVDDVLLWDVRTVT